MKVKQEFSNRCEAITLTSYATTATAADDTITVASNSITTGTEIVLNLDGGTAQGLTDEETYYWIRVDATSGKVATTKALAIAGTAVNVTGDAGAGDVFPVYKISGGGKLYVGTSGNLKLKGRGDSVAGGTTWVTHSSIPVGFFEADIAEIHSHSATASGLVVWYFG